MFGLHADEPSSYLSSILSPPLALPPASPSPAMSFADLLPRQQAVLAAHAAACDLVPPHLRRAVILIGGAAALYYRVPGVDTKDTDIACSVQALAFVDEAAANNEGDFRKDPFGVVKWGMSRFGFETEVDFVEMPGECVPRLLSVVAREDGKGFVATLTELVRLRCETCMSRGKTRTTSTSGTSSSSWKARGSSCPCQWEEELETLAEAARGLGGGRWTRILSSMIPSALRGAWNN